MITTLREFVYKEGLEKLLLRMDTILESMDKRALSNPVIVAASITNEEAIINKIKVTYTCFNITDIKIELNNQRVSFRIHGTCYIPSKYKSYIIMKWSDIQTEECDYLLEITEEDSESKTIALTEFINNGIEMTIV